MKSVSFLAAATVLLFLGCESSVDPFLGTPEPFTIWGVLSSSADTQKVRVFTVEGRPGIDRPNGIDASVSSTDLTTGERVDWRDREVIYDDGAKGHVFWAPFRAVEGHRYRLAVVRPDGAVSSAEVTIPPPVEVEIETSSPLSTLPVRILGDAPHVIGAEVSYEATNLPPIQGWPEGRLVHPLVVHPVDVSYQDELRRIPGGWEFRIQMQRDYDIVRSEFEQNCLVTAGAPDISLRRVELRFVAVDSAWYPPNGRFDPELLVEPGALSNVENGFGFIGAGHVVRLRWTPPREVRDRLGYRQGQPCDEAMPQPACMDPPIPCLGENAENVWEIYF